MSNKLRLKIGDFELEVEGDSELIEKERKEFCDLFFQNKIIPSIDTIKNNINSNVTKKTKKIVKKNLQNKSEKKQINFELLNISLDDLEYPKKYCDISKFKDDIKSQILVTMLIYTTQKNIEYFSCGDIELLLTKKFKSKANYNKIHYVVCKEKLLFHKEESGENAKKVKLLETGIKEAEEIIKNEQNKTE